ncbi:MAG: hypothetical protein V4610_17065 [Pseudomonadota bacterium]
MEPLPEQKAGAFDERYPDGMDFSWLASDGGGHVAVLVTAGRGPVPSSAFSRADILAEDHEEFLWEMPKICDAQLVMPGYERADFPQLAERGLTVFDWTDMHRVRDYANAYEVVARPASPVSIDDLPEKLRAVARDLAFPDIRFSEVASFDPRHWVKTLDALRQG